MKAYTHFEIIKRSHKRSKDFGLSKHKFANADKMTANELNSRKQTNIRLLAAARPFMNDIHDILRGTGFLILLTDENGCILKITGDMEIKKTAAKANLVEGAYMSEQYMGTNAVGTAIEEDTAVQVTSGEHANSALQNWTCSAAPIHDSKNNLLGTINLTGDKTQVHPHTLGLVIEAAKAIEEKIQSNLVEKQLYEAQNYAFSMMNNLAYGVFAIDFANNIQWVNDTACRTINIRRMHLVNQPITGIFPEWPTIKRQLLRGEEHNDEPHHFAIRNIPEKFLFNAYPIKTRKQETLGFLLTFRSYKKVMKLVNKFGGLNAHYTFADIEGSSESMKNVVHYAQSVAKSPSTVLITGESGTGKEVFAQAIHNESNRSQHGFVAINCGAISPSLIESELFGYEDGAFTGAKKGGKHGKFEYADGGTLFLDEIGEMSLEMQIRLLRTIQEGTISRVGSNHVIKVNVRIIAATNKDLKQEVDAGRFRLDLFYRLNVIEINIPPLRERRGDILTLARRFLRQKAEQLQKPIPEFTRENQMELLHYHWPGNVRELQNFMEKTVLLNGKITLNDYQQQHKNQRHQQESEFLPAGQVVSIEEAEKKAIKNALISYNGNISKAARVLGIGRNTLYNKMKKQGIDPREFQ